MKETQIYDADELAERWEYLYAKKTIKDIKKRLEVDYKRGNWHALHIALWTWLSLNGEREKSEWFEAFNVPEVRNYCFACEEAEDCHHCPLTKSTSKCGYVLLDCLNGLYEQWNEADSLERREKLAMEIATMKWEERL